MPSIKEKELIDQACKNLSDKLGGSEITSAMSRNRILDSTISVAGITFGVIAKSVVMSSNMSFTIQQAKDAHEATNLPILLVLGYVQPSIMQTMYDNGISVIDYAGNCMIKQGLLCVNVSGQKNTYRNDTKSHALSEGAIKLIYRFLSDKSFVGKAYRTISSETGMSLGSIKNTIEELTNRQFVMHTDKGRKLINEDKLLELWVQAYNQTIRPKLMLRRMSFRTDEMRSKWQEMNLPEGMLWGGDCGANLTDGYLVPGSFEIYTSKPSAMLMTTGMVMPNENGEITLYQKFWNDDNDTKVAPKLIIYADLMNSGDSRQIEAAQRLISRCAK